MWWRAQCFSQCVPVSTMLVTFPVSLPFFWPPVCARGQKLTSCAQAHKPLGLRWGITLLSLFCNLLNPCILWAGAALIVTFPGDMRAGLISRLDPGLPPALPISSLGSRLFPWLLLQSATLEFLPPPPFSWGGGSLLCLVGVPRCAPQWSGLIQPVIQLAYDLPR